MPHQDLVKTMTLTSVRASEPHRWPQRPEREDDDNGSQRKLGTMLSWRAQADAHADNSREEKDEGEHALLEPFLLRHRIGGDCVRLPIRMLDHA